MRFNQFMLLNLSWLKYSVVASRPLSRGTTAIAACGLDHAQWALQSVRPESVDVHRLRPCNFSDLPEPELILQESMGASFFAGL